MLRSCLRSCFSDRPSASNLPRPRAAQHAWPSVTMRAFWAFWYAHAWRTHRGPHSCLCPRREADSHAPTQRDSGARPGLKFYQSSRQRAGGRGGLFEGSLRLRPRPFKYYNSPESRNLNIASKFTETILSAGRGALRIC